MTELKNPRASDSESDDEQGPQLPSTHQKKKAKVLQHERTFLENLPESDMYEKSLMHRDVINFVHVTKTDFIITTSIDGHVKFWKKCEQGIEFVKHFRAHLGAIIAIDVNYDGTLLSTVGADKAMKIFDVVNFDMINIIKLDYSPRSVCWMYRKGEADYFLGCSEKDNSNIHVYNGKGSSTPLFTCKTLHNSPVHIMKFNHVDNVVVSVDESGMIEYWQPHPDSGFIHPESINWTYKSDTDLYEFKKCKTVPTCLNFSLDFSKFVTFGMGDRFVRIFNFHTGKLIKKFDETVGVASEMQAAGTAVYKVDDMEFGRRVAVEREIEGIKGGGQAATVNVVFDETGNFIIYPTILGIKIVNITTNKVVRLIGKMENQRFMHISLYQGAPRKKNLITMAMAASDNPLYKESEKRDPTIFCTAYKRNRFYIFTKRDPDTGEQSTNRDIFNEKPTREEQTVAMAQNRQIGSSAILHTSIGDIHVKLFPEYAAKAVENFVGLCKKGYYDNLIFHRVIKAFMIQTGDPEGDGTGGESLWGSNFEDEFNGKVRHDQPYTLSMANCGPGTNGSQFFITTVPTPWLDDKHTIFGRCTGGFDVVHRIENSETSKLDKPVEDIKIFSVEVK